MSVVVALELHRKLNKQRVRKPRLFAETSEAFSRAWAIYPETGRKRSSTAEAWPAWREVAERLGEEALEAAVAAFAADPESKREYGALGFHRWLKWGRWEHWLSRQAPVTSIEAKRFPDETLRDSFFERVKDERARRWFDRCALEGRTLLHPGWALREEWVERVLWPWCEENNVDGYKRAP